MNQTDETAKQRIKCALAIMKGGWLMDRPTNDVWDLAGDRNKPTRVAIMAFLNGKKLPVAKCGVNAIDAKFRELLSPPSNVRTETAIENFRKENNC